MLAFYFLPTGDVFNIQDVHWYDAASFQGDWKASQALTVNRGVRYDYFQPTYERPEE